MKIFTLVSSMVIFMWGNLSAQGAVNALQFDGNDYVAASLVTTVTDNLTMEEWVKWEGGNAVNQLLIYNGNSGVNGYGIVLNPFTLPDSNLGILCGGVAYLTSSTTFTIGVWHHVAAVRSGGIWKLYLDGIQLGLTNSFVIPNTPATTGTNIGQNAFAGTIDEVRVWNIARTESEIQSTLNLPLNGNETGLVAYWNFDEGSGSTTADITSNNNDGTVNGATWVVSTVVLPVELTSFTAIAKGKNIELKWNTATEVNNFGFEIEKTVISDQSSVISWSKAGFVEGNGTTNSLKEYSFIDKNLKKGRYAFRLKQIDRDGKFEYSQSVEVTVSVAPNEFALMQNYPNPFNPTTMISYQLPVSNHVSLKVYDAIGREVATLVNEIKEAGYYSATFDASKLSSGIYFAKLTSDGKSQMKKLMLMK